MRLMGGAPTGVRSRRRAPARRRAQVVIAVVVVALLGVGCGGGGSGATADSEPPFSRDAARLALVPVDELRPLVAFGFDIREQPVLDPRQTSLTTLRGPCGASVDTAFLADGATGVYRSTVSLIVEAVAQPGAARASGLLSTLAADNRRGCGAFDEQVGGASARIELLGEVPLAAIGDERLAWEQSVTSADGTVGYRVMIVLRSGGRVVVGAVLLTKRVHQDRIGELAAVLARHAFGPAAVPADALPQGTAPGGTLPLEPDGTLPPASAPDGTAVPAAVRSGR